MASAETLLISAILTSGSKNDLNKASFTSENMAKYRNQMFFILESRNVPSKKAFKAKFPNFIVQKIPASDIENLIAQCKDNKMRQDIATLLVDSAKEYTERRATYQSIS